jgi:hypothetical protein
MRSLARLVVAGTIAGLLTVAPPTRAEAVVVPATLYHERPVSSAPVVPGFPIDHVGVVVVLPDRLDHERAEAGLAGVAVRVRHDGRWGPWTTLIEDGAQAEGTWTSALVTAADADAYQVRGLPAWAREVRVGAINTTDGPPVQVGERPAVGAQALTPCKARVDWGADESIRTSSRSYARMRIATVHHTATGNDDPDPDARVRAIYAYHVRTNGWADIGYQALISEDGTIYEGRWSGSDSPSCRTSSGTTLPFGHRGTTTTADIVVGAHTGGWNTGNFGVALLGTLTTREAAPAARAALVAYLDELTARHGIDPDTQVAFSTGSTTKTVWTISGHRDFTATECPGGALYARLPAIRTEVRTRQTNVAPTVTITTPTSAATHEVTEASVGAGVSVTLAATATDESPATLAWRWTDAAGTVLATSSGLTRTFPVGTHALTVRVTDAGGLVATDRLDLTVVAASPPVAPTTPPTLTAGLEVVARKHQARLVWSGASSVTVRKDLGKGERTIATVTGTTYVDVLGAKVPSSLAYRVCRTDLTSVCSDWVRLR